MSIGDFVSKTASDALGRIIAAAPGKFVNFALSAGVIEVKLDTGMESHIVTFLSKNATLLYRSIDKYSCDIECLGVEYKRNPIPNFDRQVYLIWHRPVALLKRADGYVLQYARGFDVEKLLKLALNSQSGKRKSWTFRLSHDGGKVKLTASNMEKAAPHVWESPAYKALDMDILYWKKCREHVQARNCLWRRGWLLYGPPGNGKTFAAIRLARIHGLDIVTLSPHTSDKDFREAWACISGPAMVIIDDIDDVIKGRENVKDPKDGLAFSTLLNCLDGTNSIDGVLTVISTNRLDVIDSALGRPRDDTHWNQLSTRPGRLDRCVRFDNPDLAGRVAIGRLLLTDEAKIQRLAAEHVDVSVAQFHSICQEAAYAEVQGEE